MDETKVIEGKITTITPVKRLGASGKLLSIGIRLENDENWHNITSFSMKELNNILGDIRPGDEVKITEKLTNNYWNIVKIEKKTQRTLEKIPSKIEINDKAIFEKAILDALEIIRKLFEDPYNKGRSFFSPEIESRLAIEIAKELFKQRLK